MIVERIKELCDKQSISVSALSKALGFNKNTIHAWEGHMPAADKLQAVADYFNVSLDYLMGRTDDPRMRGGEDILGNLAEDERTALEAFLKTYREQKNKSQN